MLRQYIPLYCIIYNCTLFIHCSLGVLTLLVGWQEGNLACKSSATTILKSLLLATGLTWSLSEKSDSLTKHVVGRATGNKMIKLLFWKHTIHESKLLSLYVTKLFLPIGTWLSYTRSPTLDQSPIGSRFTPRLMSAYATKKKLSITQKRHQKLHVVFAENADITSWHIHTIRVYGLHRLWARLGQIDSKATFRAQNIQILSTHCFIRSIWLFKVY